jgi:hypothetical protein
MIYTASDGSEWSIQFFAPWSSYLGAPMSGETLRLWPESKGKIEAETQAACVAAIEEHVRKEKKENAK